MNREEWDHSCKKYNYKGFGNEHAGIWFVGQEFHGSDETSTGCGEGERIYPITSEQIRRESTGKSHTLIYAYMSRIMWNLNGLEKRHLEYRDKRLLQTSDGSFFTNIFSLSRLYNESQDLTPLMKQLGFKDMADYENAMRLYRFPMLRDFWRQEKPRLTVCFLGEERRDDFCALFEIEPSEKPTLLADNKVEFYEKQGLVLTPFFGNGLKMAVVDAISNKIKNS